MTDKDKEEALLVGDKRALSKSGYESTEPPTSLIVSDWELFSSAGITDSTASQVLAASLADSEKWHTRLAALNRENHQLEQRRQTMDDTEASKDKESKYTNDLKLINKFTIQLVSRVAIDEAFVEFWSDALLGSVASCRPVFFNLSIEINRQYAVNTVLLHTDGVKVSWIVIEQVITVPRSRPTCEQEEATAVRAPPQNSSMRSDVSDKRKLVITED